MTVAASPSLTLPPETNRPEPIFRRVVSGDELPAWFSVGLSVALVWCAVAGITAMLLLSAKHYSAWTCTIVATAAALVSLPFRPRPQGRTAHGPALAAVAIALVLLGTSGAYHSQHLLSDRDPGVYLNTGRSIARTHLVHPPIPASPFDDTTVYRNQSAGFTVSNHRLFSNFLNFLPALMALGWSAGGDTGLLLVPAILGALALLALYALGTRIVGPRWALLGPALLTLAPLESWFSRDAYAELAMQVLALGGLWLLLEVRRRAPGRALGDVVAGVIAGVVFGAVTFVRVDALALLVALPAALVVEWIRAAEREEPTRRRWRQAMVAFATAAVVIGVLGVRITRRQSGGYYIALKHDLHMLHLALAAGVLLAVAIAVGHLLFRGFGRRIARNNVVLGVAIAAFVGVVFYAYKIRPRTGTAPIKNDPTAPRAVRQAMHKAFQTYFASSSLRWFAWYFGTVALVLIVIGFVVLAVRALRTDSPALLLLAAAAPVTLLYVARPSISPDHLWAMRRYLPMVLPVMTIAAAAAAACGVALLATRWPRLRAPAAVVLVALMLMPAAKAGKPFVRAQMQHGTLDAVHTICKKVGPNGALAIEPDGLLAITLPQAVRGFCGVPAGSVKRHAVHPVGADAAAWKERGRTLFIASVLPNPAVVPGAKASLVAHMTIDDATEPARAVGRRPNSYGPRPFDIWIYRVDTT
jgi:hypothetical protein